MNGININLTLLSLIFRKTTYNDSTSGYKPGTTIHNGTVPRYINTMTMTKGNTCRILGTLYFNQIKTRKTQRIHVRK